MKWFTRFFFAAIFILNISSIINAQSAEGNVVTVQNIEAAFPEEGSMAEFDSLTHLYNTKVWDKNPYVISHKTIRHWWGNNNRDIIEITEVASWEDVLKANEKNGELFNEAWSTKQERDAFNKAYNKYFTGKHSDEIYREVKFGN